jgi:hypothetical protein
MLKNLGDVGSNPTLTAKNKTMADITKCKGTNCAMKQNCYRFTAKESYYQPFFTEVPLTDESCVYFWDNKKVIKNTLNLQQ